jgi:hypothetical protein
VTVSSQDEAEFGPETEAVAGILRAQGRPVDLVQHLPRRGLAEHRQSLLERATAPYVLFLDDGVVLEADVVERLVAAIRRERCGFVGSALLGWSFADDVRPHEQAIELWDGPVTPEHIEPGSRAWARHTLHSAANLLHVARRLDVPRWPPRSPGSGDACCTTPQRSGKSGASASGGTCRTSTQARTSSRSSG